MHERPIRLTLRPTSLLWRFINVLAFFGTSPESTNNRENLSPYSTSALQPPHRHPWSVMPVSLLRSQLQLVRLPCMQASVMACVMPADVIALRKAASRLPARGSVNDNKKGKVHVRTIIDILSNEGNHEGFFSFFFLFRNHNKSLSYEYKIIWVWIWILFYFIWLLGRQVLCRSIISCPMIWSPFRETWPWGQSTLPTVQRPVAKRFELGTPWLRVQSLIHWATVAQCTDEILVNNVWFQ